MFLSYIVDFRDEWVDLRTVNRPQLLRILDTSEEMLIGEKPGDGWEINSQQVLNVYDALHAGIDPSVIMAKIKATGELDLSDLDKMVPVSTVRILDKIQDAFITFGVPEDVADALDYEAIFSNLVDANVLGETLYHGKTSYLVVNNPVMLQALRSRTAKHKRRSSLSPKLRT